MTSQTKSRNSSPKSPTHRPRLLRASVTEPSLATSNASRNDLASLHCTSPSSRATTLLNRVASYSSAQHELALSRRSVCESPQSSPGGSERGSKGPFEIAISQSGNYYSFPSFEDFQEYLESSNEQKNS